MLGLWGVYRGYIGGILGICLDYGVYIGGI